MYVLELPILLVNVYLIGTVFYCCILGINVKLLFIQIHIHQQGLREHPLTRLDCPLMRLHMLQLQQLLGRIFLVIHLRIFHQPNNVKQHNLFSRVHDLVAQHRQLQILEMLFLLQLLRDYHQAHQWVHWLQKDQHLILMPRQSRHILV